MPYDQNNPYQRLDDGVYIEYMNNTILLSDSVIVNSTVKLPNSLNNKYWNVTGETKKARWLDLTYNNGNVVNNNSNIIVNDFIEFKCDLRLSLFDKVTKLLVNASGDFKILYYDINHSNETEISNNTSLTSLNLTSETFYLRIVKTGSNLTLNNIDISIVTLKKNTDDDFLISTENIANLNNLFNTQFDTMYPPGIVIEMADNKDPNDTMRGKWEQTHKGRVPVGLDTTQAEFNTIGKTGGEKAVTLTTAQMPVHTHTQNAHTHTQNAHTHIQNDHRHQVKDTGGYAIATSRTGRILTSNTGSSATYNYVFSNAGSILVYGDYVTPTNQNTTAVNQNTTATNQNTGGGQAHNNLQPYEVSVFWKRVA